MGKPIILAFILVLSLFLIPLVSANSDLGEELISPTREYIEPTSKVTHYPNYRITQTGNELNYEVTLNEYAKDPSFWDKILRAFGFKIDEKIEYILEIRVPNVDKYESEPQLTNDVLLKETTEDYDARVIELEKEYDIVDAERKEILVYDKLPVKDKQDKLVSEIGKTLENNSYIYYYVFNEEGLYLKFGEGTITMDGSGTSGDPYQITNCTQLQEMREDLSAYYVLNNSINCSETKTWNFNQTGTDVYNGFIPIGTFGASFTGTFDGQGNTISNLYINRPATNFVGLFGHATTGSVIENLGIIDVNITGYEDVGSLGSTSGVVSNCYSTGNVLGKYIYIGGFAGGVAPGGVIQNSYSSVNVTTETTQAGGFAGRNRKGKILNCYSTGVVTGEASSGFSHRQYTGGVYEDSGNFWDIEASGKATSNGNATGKTTDEMKDITTFSDASWNITHTRDFTNEIWKIDHRYDYPKLGWEDWADIFAPIFDIVPSDEDKVYGTIWNGVQFEAYDNMYIDTWWVNDTTNFNINQSGFLTWGDYLNAGNYSINVSVNDTSNNVNSVVYNLEITQKELTITADNKEKVYGTSDPSFTVTYVGFVLDEDETDLGGTLSFNRQEGESVGDYDITPSGLTSTNYDINFVDGVLTIVQAVPSLVLSSSSGWSLTSAEYSTIEGTGCPAQLECLLYEEKVNVSNPYTKLFSMGLYSFEFNTTGNQNYTSFSVTNILRSEMGAEQISMIKCRYKKFGYYNEGIPFMKEECV